MEVDFLLSFKNHPSYQNLDDEFLKKFSLLLKTNKKAKNKKSKNHENKKTSTQIKEKIQISKDKTENKFGLLINKLDSSNIDKIIEEFINKFKDISENEFIIFQKNIFIRILKDSKFQDLFLYFFMKIKKIYNIIKNYDEKYLISLIEFKFKYDYDKNFVNSLQYKSFINEYPSIDDVLKLVSEENRINNLLTILKFIEKGYFKNTIIEDISEKIMLSDHIPDIYKFVNYNYIKSNFDHNCYHDILKSKFSDNMDNRYRVLLSSILENFDSDDLNDCNDLSNNYDDDESGLINYDINMKTVQSFDQFKSEIEIEIGNILEEYLLIEDFDEINTYIENQNNIDNFMSELFNFYFKNNLNNFDKFKSLFLNFRNNQIISSEIMLESLFKILESDIILDYVNVSTKILKLLEIFKILQIKLNKNQDDSLKKIIVN